MAGVKGSQPANLEAPVPEAPLPEAVKMPEQAASAAPAPQGTPAPQAAATPDPLEALANEHAQGQPAGKDPLEALADEHASGETGAWESYGKPALEGAARVLDYPGGHLRTAIATAAGAVMGKPLTTDEDVKAAFKGKAPSSEEYLKRAGVPEGPELSIPGVGRVTLRDAEGLALDIATDPLTAVTKLAREVPYIGKFINTAGKGSEWVADKIYDSAFKKVDAKLAAKRTEPLSQVMREGGLGADEIAKMKANGVAVPQSLEQGAATGTAKGLEATADHMANEMGNFRKTLYDKADQAGASIDLAKPGLTKNADAVLEAMKKDRGLAPQAAELEELLNRYKQGTASIADLSAEKTNLYNALPKSHFDANGKASNVAMRFKAALALDMKNAIVAEGNRVEKGLGDAIDAVNGKWGVLIESRKPMAQVANSSGGTLGHAIDATILGSGHVGTYAAKKALELGTSTYARTQFGKALSAAGRAGLIDAMTRRAIIDAGQSPLPAPLKQPEEP